MLNQWDLIVNDLTADVKCSLNSNDPDCQKTDCISTSIENGLNNLNNGNFALMNTFDCNKFGESGKCISIGIRNIQVNEPKSDIDGIVFVYGHKTSPNNRWGFFINSNISFLSSYKYLCFNTIFPLSQPVLPTVQINFQITSNRTQV